MRPSVVAMRLRIRALPKSRKAKSRKAKPKSVAKNSSLTRREAERREAHHRAASKSDAARVLSPSPHAERTEAAGTSWSGRARLSAPHRGIRGFDLGSARAALPGTTGCKREDP